MASGPLDGTPPVKLPLTGVSVSKPLSVGSTSGRGDSSFFPEVWGSTHETPQRTQGGFLWVVVGYKFKEYLICKPQSPLLVWIHLGRSIQPSDSSLSLIRNHTGSFGSAKDPYLILRGHFGPFGEERVGTFPSGPGTGGRFGGLGKGRTITGDRDGHPLLPLSVGASSGSEVTKTGPCDSRLSPTRVHRDEDVRDCERDSVRCVPWSAAGDRSRSHRVESKESCVESSSFSFEKGVEGRGCLGDSRGPGVVGLSLVHRVWEGSRSSQSRLHRSRRRFCT